MNTINIKIYSNIPYFLDFVNSRFLLSSLYFTEIILQDYYCMLNDYKNLIDSKMTLYDDMWDLVEGLR